jgi:hypothetical protein
MNIADELQKLQDLHRSGALTDEEFAAAKAAVLAGAPAAQDSTRPGAMQEELDDLRLENEVARLDREWQLSRERYMVAGRYGNRYVPSRGQSVLGGVIVVAFGIFWTATAASMGAGLFPLFGVIFILLGAGMSVYSYSKAGEYEEAYQKYQRRRAELLGQSRQRKER